MAAPGPPGPPPVPIPDIGLRAGPQYVGIMCNAYLYGMLVLQFYNYHTRFRNDYPILRAIVHVQFLLETAQTIMSVADGFHWFVDGYGVGDQLSEFFLAAIDTPILCTLIAVISQGAYCWRIYRLSGWRVITSLIVVVILGQIAGGLGVGILMQQIGLITKWNHKVEAFMIVWTICTTVADVAIAVVMTWLLVSNSSYMNMLIINNNAYQATVSIVQLLTTLIGPIKPPRTTMFLAPGYILGKLYSNSFLMMMNNRRFAGGVNEEVVTPGVGEPIVQLRPRHIHTSEAVLVGKETAVHFDNVSSSSYGPSGEAKVRFSEI
ncbi:hypothetical protein AGABI1DRAFT_129392 [Agaricus bisporus var. burnettii JB137-S8]|uniref:DUF6534 domain-containing protein n=1 Tax=Agaricus bisporus var. burnettii (strain JB137-S8 / ATCC MYA-4627 / FGSC 10392) TaxID=597362 RepID=K5X514_AGABU|nr:uncharacterized protein AGABI1DRAFT_129392 [Agaricus bisporus var. burnettii JB137-S8]EKM78273.1 hypothetical protein AGABI1DRAFT_129392 [Agaricus bisporus var. burnettii JB137-S8]